MLCDMQRDLQCASLDPDETNALRCDIAIFTYLKNHLHITKNTILALIAQSSATASTFELRQYFGALLDTVDLLLQSHVLCRELPIPDSCDAIRNGMYTLFYKQ